MHIRSEYTMNTKPIVEPKDVSEDPDRTGPIFVVGQPRSGSTITTRVLNEAEGLFILNDFYALQAIDADNLWDRNDPDSARKIAGIVFDRVRIRATQERGKTLNQSIDLSAEAVTELALLADGPWPAGSTWHRVMEIMLGRAAELAGCARWGWNTPQDHVHLNRLFAAWPSSQALFVLRGPEAVLRSYKNVSGPWHDARRYNPGTIGLAWKVAARSYVTLHDAHPDRVMLLRYEDLVSDTAGSVSALSRFLGVRFGSVHLAEFGRNSSHDGGGRTRAVTPAEVWLAERVIGPSLRDLGFAPSVAKFRLDGVPELLRTVVGSGTFIARQILTDRDRRKRAFHFLKQG